MINELKIFKAVESPDKGNGKTLFKPGQWLSRPEACEFVGVSAPTLYKLLHEVACDAYFRRDKLRLVRIRHPRAFVDFQTACYLLQQQNRKASLKKRRKKKRDDAATYLQRERDAFLRGELGTSPPRSDGHIENLRDLGLDPLKGR